MVKTILIPTDFSDSTIDGIRYVAAQLADHPVHCYLLHIVEHSASRTLYSAETETAGRPETGEQVLGKLRRMIDGFTLLSGMTLEPAVRYGEPWREIVRFAQGMKADLIVSAAGSGSETSGGSGHRVTDMIARFSPVPVLMVKPGTVPASPVPWEEFRDQVHIQYEGRHEPNR